MPLRHSSRHRKLSGNRAISCLSQCLYDCILSSSSSFLSWSEQSGEQGRECIDWVQRRRRSLSRPPSYNTVSKPPRYSLCGKNTEQSVLENHFKSFSPCMINLWFPNQVWLCDITDHLAVWIESRTWDQVWDLQALTWDALRSAWLRYLLRS